MEVQELLKCVSCKRSLANVGGIKFICPNCGQASIARCNICKRDGITYQCPKCGFEGP